MSDAVNQRASQRSTHLGKYFLLDLVHAGSTAEILKAKTVGIEGFERILAIKRLLPDVSKDRALVARLLEEARTAGKLQHENIVQVLDVGKNENDYFVALEFVEGRDLRSICEVIREQGQRMPTSLTCYLVMQLCDGLDFVHSSCDARGRSLHLVHGDVSPHHVLVSYEGEVKLTGFGSIDAASQTARPPLEIRTRDLGYLSPEQVLGLPVDLRSDVFALGVVFHEMLTGERLFEGQNDFVTLEKVRNSSTGPPSWLRADIPATLDRIVLKALEQNVEERYQSTVDLRRDIEDFLESVGESPERGDLSTWMRRTFPKDAVTPASTPREGITTRTSPGVRPVGSAVSPEEALSWDEEEKLTEVFDRGPGKPHVNAVEGRSVAAVDATTGGAEPMPMLQAGTNNVLPAPPPRQVPDSAAHWARSAPQPSSPTSRQTEMRRPQAVWAAPPLLPSSGSNQPPSFTPPSTPRMPFELPPQARALPYTPFPGAPVSLQPPQTSPYVPVYAMPPRRMRQPRISYAGYYVAAALLVLLVGAGFYWFWPRVGVLLVSVKPPDARLAVDGVSLSGDPPYRLARSAGVHRLAASLPGYVPYERSIQISRGQKGRLGVVLTPAPDTGFVLTSTPADGLVWLDGRPLVLDKRGGQARTGLQAMAIAPGPHVLEIKDKPGFQPWEHYFVQEPGRTVHLHANLMPIGGPRAESGPADQPSKVAAKADRTRDSGKRRRRRSRQLAQESTTSAEPLKGVSHANAQSVSGPMEDIFENYGRSVVGGGKCVATIGSKPWAELIIDGKPTGKLTPVVNYSLPCGTHRLTFRNEDLMIERNERITLHAGRPFKRIFQLVGYEL